MLPNRDTEVLMQRSVQLMEKFFLQSKLRNWTLRTWARLHRVFGEKVPDLPAEVKQYPRRSNPQLGYLISRYAALNSLTTPCGRNGRSK